MSDDEIPGFDGPLEISPDDVTPVGAFGFGFGNIAGVDDEGVQSHPVVLLQTNEGTGPTLMFDALAVQPLVTGLMGAALKSMTLFDPNLKKVVGESADDMFRMLGEMEKTPDQRQRDAEDHKLRRLERFQLVYGLVIILLGAALSFVWGWGWFLTSIIIFFAVQGFASNLVRGVFVARHWIGDRRRKREHARAFADVDDLRPPD